MYMARSVTAFRRLNENGMEGKSSVSRQNGTAGPSVRDALAGESRSSHGKVVFAHSGF